MDPPKRMVSMSKILTSTNQTYRLDFHDQNSRDGFYRNMLESLNKIMLRSEVPAKEKHIRKIVIGSHQVGGCSFVWKYLMVDLLRSNQFSAWKFCYFLHKLIRDGHQSNVKGSWDNRNTLLGVGNMWRHVETGYGRLIYKYCRLLFNRLNFHVRNPGFPSDLKVSDEQLDEICEQDPNIFFELSCELFDALDDILKLQELVLASVDKLKLGSMTNAGQCHLCPLVVLIQDSTQLYDYSVKILFKLHATLPEITLEGHRERLLEQHRLLRSFYLNTSNLQYFRTLIQIPHLSERAPNFLIASDLQQHVAPRFIMITDPERESPEQVLVDLDEGRQNDDSGSTVSYEQRPETSNSITSQLGHDSIDTIFSSSPDPLQATINPQDSQVSRLDHRDDRIKELEQMVDALRSELELEKSKHAGTKETLETQMKKLSHELSNCKHSVTASKSAYEKLAEECKRAQHDNEISQVAMKRLAKEMSELKSKQHEAQSNARKETNDREEDLLVAEMNETDKIIKEATKKIEELSEKSRKVESGVKLQVNEKISEVCTNLMKAVRNLIIQSRILQREIVGEGGVINSAEFYKRNSSWTEGLISAANVVAMAAKSLVEAADRSMSGQAKFSELAAAAHEIAAATTQLVVASRVKANKDSEKLKILTNAAKQVGQCTSNVVDASRVCAELIEREVDKVDISSLSLHQTKKLEMETQVKLLELEHELSKERIKLGVLRRQHYEQEEAQVASSEAAAR